MHVFTLEKLIRSSPSHPRLAQKLFIFLNEASEIEQISLDFIFIYNGPLTRFLTKKA